MLGVKYIYASPFISNISKAVNGFTEVASLHSCAWEVNEKKRKSSEVRNATRLRLACAVLCCAVLCCAVLCSWLFVLWRPKVTFYFGMGNRFKSLIVQKEGFK